MEPAPLGPEEVPARPAPRARTPQRQIRLPLARPRRRPRRRRGAVEVRMTHGVGGREAACRVVDEKPAQQVHRLLARPRQHRPPLHPLRGWGGVGGGGRGREAAVGGAGGGIEGEGLCAGREVAGGVRQAVDAGGGGGLPGGEAGEDGGGGVAEERHDAPHHVAVVLPREQRHPLPPRRRVARQRGGVGGGLGGEQLGEDAAGGPRVHRRPVGLRAHEQLRRAVGARDDVVGEASVPPNLTGGGGGEGLRGDGAGNAEVAELEVPEAAERGTGGVGNKGNTRQPIVCRWRKDLPCGLSTGVTVLKLSR